MNIFRGLYNYRYLNVPAIICLLSTGCIIREVKNLRNETALQANKIAELEAEKSRLAAEAETLRKRDTYDEGLMRTAEDRLRGTGITVRIKEDGMVSLVLPSSIFFDPGKAELKKGTKSHLKKISTLLNGEFSTNMVRVEGHTDNQPIKRAKKIYKSNWELSTARATAVLYYLINECRVNPTRLYLAGFGEYQPIASNKDKSGRDKNRRVEIVIIPRKSGT